MARSRALRPLPPKLERRAATRVPRRRILVFCEGATEERYLRWIASKFRSHLVDIEATGSVGVPETVVSRAVEARAELQRGAGRSFSSSFDQLFTVWAMFDKDDHEVAEPLNRASVNGVNAAYSNPCFELWALIHFEEHEAPDDRVRVQKKLRNLMPGYDHERSPYLVCDMLTEERMDDALGRAPTMRQRRMEEGDPIGNPYTSVDELIRQIAAASANSQSIGEAVQEIRSKIASIEESEEFQVGDAAAQRTVHELYEKLKAVRARPR